MATVTELEQELSLYKTARQNILKYGQDMSMSDGRQLTHADLKWIDTRIRDLENRIQILNNGGRINTQQAVFGGRRG